MKRSAVVALLLLLLNSLQEGKSTNAQKLLEPKDELKQLRDIVYQQGTMLVELKTEMKYVEKENAGLKTKMARQIKQLKQTQSTVERLDKETAAQAKEMSAAKTRLATSESKVENLKKENAEMNRKLAADLTDMKNLRIRMKKENTALNGRLATTESDMEHLKKDIIERPKLAFSAALTTTLIPTSGGIDVVYSKVLTNVGGAYNSNTGVFTAPIRGIYYFRFTICSGNKGYYSGLYLYKNNQQLLFIYGYNANGYREYISDGVTVQLEVGDVVRTHLGKNYALFEDTNNLNTFSGFILFAI